MRERDGEALVDLAQELVGAGSSPLREAAGLVRGAASVRLSGALSLLDALRDVYGAGSRWYSEVGPALVDVLPIWLPAAVAAGLVGLRLARLGLQARD